ncbi:Ubiquitin-protein ligase E3B [Amphibalanus amphitrite]|uniref:Ubiquitin-protein ligase E3B n=1 Tax=Amphibalanus amphitrite TaxID=1232801 RepID=A0A6A4W9R0_AMPAM|nr:Ubiquitin-protein ligase E3B [Amphibalanus amphitrite]
MFQKPDASKDAFLEQARAAREERHMQQRRERAAVRVQALVRGFLARRAARRDVTRRLEAVLQSAAGAEESPPLVAAQEVYRCVRDYLVITGGRDGQRFGQICRSVSSSAGTNGGSVPVKTDRSPYPGQYERTKWQPAWVYSGSGGLVCLCTIRDLWAKQRSIYRGRLFPLIQLISWCYVLMTAR